MNREELDRELDQWLDRATSEYGRAEIRPGFESRIIANVNSRWEKRKWHFRWIPVAAAIAAILIFSPFLLRKGFQERQIADISAERPPKPKSLPEQITNRERLGKTAIPAAKKPKNKAIKPEAQHRWNLPLRLPPTLLAPHGVRVNLWE